VHAILRIARQSYDNWKQTINWGCEGGLQVDRRAGYRSCGWKLMFPKPRARGLLSNDSKQSKQPIKITKPHNSRLWLPSQSPLFTKTQVPFESHTSFLNICNLILYFHHCKVLFTTFGESLRFRPLDAQYVVLINLDCVSNISRNTPGL
jgi:hypothetical protein